MSEAQRCPGNELNKSLGTIDIKCSSCGTVNEIFSDETGKNNKCTKCKEPLTTPQQEQCYLYSLHSGCSPN